MDQPNEHEYNQSLSKGQTQGDSSSKVRGVSSKRLNNIKLASSFQ